jgi:hypothetical protein
MRSTPSRERPRRFNENRHEKIGVSAGQRGLQMILSFRDLERAAQASLADLAKSVSQ